MDMDMDLQDLTEYVEWGTMDIKDMVITMVIISPMDLLVLLLAPPLDLLDFILQLDHLLDMVLLAAFPAMAQLKQSAAVISLLNM